MKDKSRIARFHFYYFLVAIPFRYVKGYGVRLKTTYRGPSPIKEDLGV
jgi:hypothetical protein